MCAALKAGSQRTEVLHLLMGEITMPKRTMLSQKSSDFHAEKSDGKPY